MASVIKRAYRDAAMVRASEKRAYGIGRISSDMLKDLRNESLKSGKFEQAAIIAHAQTLRKVSPLQAEMFLHSKGIAFSSAIKSSAAFNMGRINVSGSREGRNYKTSTARYTPRTSGITSARRATKQAEKQAEIPLWSAFMAEQAEKQAAKDKRAAIPQDLRALQNFRNTFNVTRP